MKYLRQEGWTREETDHLFELCRRFDTRFLRFLLNVCRWPVIASRYEHDRFPRSLDKPQRSMEDMKARFYFVVSELTALKWVLSCC